MVKTRSCFKLLVMEGTFNDSQIVVMLGENGTGKTTFIRLLAGQVMPDEVIDEEVDMPSYIVSCKPQELISKVSSTVTELLHKKVPGSCSHAKFRSDVMKPLKIEELMDRQVANLSGGELQRIALCLCLGKPADICLIGEPSAHLDSEQRLIAAKVIKRFILHGKKTAFVVEHDFIMATYLANKHLDVTFRTDPTTYRPRINKLGSVKDTEQKAAGRYYYLDY